MTPDKSVDLGHDYNGIRFEWTPTPGSHIYREGTLKVNIWDGVWTEAAAVELSGDDALTLAQCLDDWLDR